MQITSRGPHMTCAYQMGRRRRRRRIHYYALSVSSRHHTRCGFCGFCLNSYSASAISHISTGWPRL